MSFFPPHSPILYPHLTLCGYVQDAMYLIADELLFHYFTFQKQLHFLFCGGKLSDISHIE